jgi:hypothetical protein
VAAVTSIRSAADGRDRGDQLPLIELERARAKSLGASLYLPEGIYRICGSYDPDGVVLRGDGAGVTILKQMNPALPVIVPGAERWMIAVTLVRARTPKTTGGG